MQPAPQSASAPALAVRTPFQLLWDLPRIFRNTPEFLLQTSRQQGPLVELKTGLLPAYFVDHPELIRHVLQDNSGNYTHDTVQYNALAKVTGRGLLTADGYAWAAHRKLMQPGFAQARLAQLPALASTATLAMLEQWEGHAQQGRTIDLDQEMMELALTIIGQFLFGIDLQRDAQTLARATVTCLDHILYQSQNPLALPERIPTTRNLRFRRALATLDQAIFALMDQRRRDGLDGQDILSLLLRSEGLPLEAPRGMTAEGQNGSGSQAPGPLTRKQIRDELLTLLIAGHETVASALTWTFALLMQNPSSLARLEAEVSTVLNGRPPTAADLSRLTFTSQVFSEGLRLYPPAWVITRRAMAPDMLGAQSIPEGALIILSPYSIQRNPACWDEPDRFNPDRFAGMRGIKGPRFTWIPFGAGPRVCIGAQLAMLEAQVILSLVVQRFRLSPVHPGLPEPLAMVTLRPRGGLPVHVTPREGLQASA